MTILSLQISCGPFFPPLKTVKVYLNLTLEYSIRSTEIDSQLKHFDSLFGALFKFCCTAVKTRRAASAEVLLKKEIIVKMLEICTMSSSKPKLVQVIKLPSFPSLKFFFSC